jgi:hypothetical protein
VSAPTDIRNGHRGLDTQTTSAVADPIPAIADHGKPDTQPLGVGDGAQTPPASATNSPKTMKAAPVLADPLLSLAADVLDDLERVRIANENRLRQLTRVGEDKDGGERGFGLPVDDPDVARLAALVDALKDAEEQAISNLQYRMKRHALGPWVKQTKGVGEKQAARLLAAIGDPYWNDLHDRPRLVSELWSYCGYGDATRQVRQRGVKANWSDDAKKRAWLVASSCIKSNGPYREVYDDARARYADAVHPADCKRCGPAGKPAKQGSPLSAGHQHMRGLRAISKAVLRDLWREAKRLHEHPGDHWVSGTHSDLVAGALRNPTKKRASAPVAPVSDEPERAVCLVCGDDRGIRKDGTVRAHPYAGYSDGRKCPGSLLQPRWE